MKICGKGGKVCYGSVVVANIKEWSMSGFSMGTIKKDPAFGDTITEYCVDGVGDPGTISFSGNWDVADAKQVALHTACAAGTSLTDLYLYANTSTFWRVGSGGSILITKSQAITLPRSGIGTINFEGQVTGAAMELVGTGS
jgi:hypothetical protein